MSEQATVQHKNIYAALAAAQAKMGKALKEKTNPAFKSKYADLASVMDACLPALNDNGICVVQPFVEIDGQRFVKTVLAHDSGETLETLVPLVVSKNDMQGLGSAMTYARRYGLMGMAGVAPDDDDGNAAAAAPPRAAANAQQAPPPPHSADKADAMIAAIEKRGLSMVDHPRFAPDLDALRQASAEDAKRVEQAVADLKSKQQPALTDDEIPY